MMIGWKVCTVQCTSAISVKIEGIAFSVILRGFAMNWDFSKSWMTKNPKKIFLMRGFTLLRVSILQVLTILLFLIRSCATQRFYSRLTPVASSLLRKTAIPDLPRPFHTESVSATLITSPNTSSWRVPIGYFQEATRLSNKKDLLTTFDGPTECLSRISRVSWISVGDDFSSLRNSHKSVVTSSWEPSNLSTFSIRNCKKMYNFVNYSSLGMKWNAVFCMLPEVLEVDSFPWLFANVPTSRDMYPVCSGTTSRGPPTFPPRGPCRHFDPMQGSPSIQWIPICFDPSSKRAHCRC